MVTGYIEMPSLCTNHILIIHFSRDWVKVFILWLTVIGCWNSSIFLSPIDFYIVIIGTSGS